MKIVISYNILGIKVGEIFNAKMNLEWRQISGAPLAPKWCMSIIYVYW